MRYIFPTVKKIVTAIAALPDEILSGLDAVLSHLKRRGFGDWPAALLLLSPALIILTVFVLAPMASSFYMSLFGGRHGMGDYVGFGNYVAALDLSLIHI